MGILSLTTPQDLLKKCKKEMSSFSSVEFNDYQLFNVIFSLNYLYEWAYKDKNMDPQKAKIIAEHFFPFENISQCHCDTLKKLFLMMLKPIPIRWQLDFYPINRNILLKSPILQL